MRHGRRVVPVLASLVLALTIAPLPVAARPAMSGAPMRWQVAVVPIGRFMSFVAEPFRYRAPHAGGTALAREQGWRSLSFPMGEPGLGVYLSVEGEAQFDVAYIDYADGGQDRIELAQAHRADGLFALAEYAGERPVARVSLLARALTPQARIAVLLGR